MKKVAALAPVIGVFLLSIACANPQGSQNPLPDLTVAMTPAASSAKTAASPWPFTVTVTNAGSTDAAASQLEYRISNDAVPAGPDVVINVTIPSLPAGGIFDASLSGLISAHGVVSGTNHVAVTVESSDSNNKATSTLPVIYDRIIIDTYNPLAPVSGSPVYGIDSMDLYNSLGTSQLDTNNGSGNPDPDQVSFAYLDHTSLAPGDYQVRIYATNPGDSGPYAIRVLTAPDTIPRASSWYFLTALGSGDTLPPTPTIHIGEKLNRFVATNATDTITLTLR